MTDPDRGLARKARRGDRGALGRLYERHRERLLGFLTRTLGDRQSAEDVFQEVWIKVLNGIGNYRPGPATFRAWLFRIAGNAAIDRRRREGHAPLLELDAPTGDSEQTRIDTLRSEMPGPERVGASKLFGERLDAALARLPERQRNAVLLRHQQGLTYPELAAALAAPEGTAKTLVHRGVRTLRDELEEWIDD